MPSVLAIRDLRRALRRRVRNRGISDDELVPLLHLDPLAVLRGLRAATAPVFGSRPERWTIYGMSQVLGMSLTRRLFDTPPRSVAGTTPVRRLWLHSIATACAASELATASGLCDPAEAYLHGLLHDLPQWLSLIGRYQHGASSSTSSAQWVTQWHLPASLAETLADRDAAGGDAPTQRSPISTLVHAAELLAELADFPHPDHGSEATALCLAAANKANLVAAKRLRREVENSLGAFSLDLRLPDFEAELEGAGEEDSGPLFRTPQHGTVDEIVLGILNCAESRSYRGIVTALTASAVRYGGYDRAFYVKWNPASNRLFLRSKADSSARRVAMSVIDPTASEVAAIRLSQLEERPLRLDAQANQRNGLLSALSVDEALLVPLNRNLAMPAMLVLDRSLSLAPIQFVLESSMATTLGLTGSLLIENLLLRGRQKRALQFAATDDLTRLFNRRMGIQLLDQEMARSARTDKPLTVLMCDLDHFKHLNDTFGHHQGDLALRATADVLRQTLRRTDTICRYGGEEFLIALPETGVDEATVLAARLFTAVEARGREMALPITISIGMTSCRPSDNLERALCRADQALYASKGSGRNRFSVDLEDSEEPVQRQ